MKSTPGFDYNSVPKCKDRTYFYDESESKWEKGKMKFDILSNIIFTYYWQAANPTKPLNVGKTIVNIAVCSLAI